MYLGSEVRNDSSGEIKKEKKYGFNFFFLYCCFAVVTGERVWRMVLHNHYKNVRIPEATVNVSCWIMFFKVHFST